MNYHGWTAEQIREYVPGYIGGIKVANRATDEEVISLCHISDEIARLFNQLQDLKKQRNRMYKVIERRY